MNPTFSQTVAIQQLANFAANLTDHIGPAFRVAALFEAVKASDLTAAEVRTLAQRLDREADQIERDAE
jgi:hypothetical protein